MPSNSVGYANADPKVSKDGSLGCSGLVMILVHFTAPSWDNLMRSTIAGGVMVRMKSPSLAAIRKMAKIISESLAQ